MYKILEKKILARDIKQFTIKAPEVATYCKAGQFIILRINEKGERIPLTIYDFFFEKGTIDIIFQEVGRTTYELGKMEQGESLLDFVGPLGVPFEQEIELNKIKKVICVGGGLGVAPIYPKIKFLKEKGVEVISIIGARSKNLVILEQEVKNISNELYVCTDDGTYGEKGFVTQVLKRLLDNEAKPDLVVAIGPIPMMKASSKVTELYQIKTLVSLNSIMVDGTGMCGSCRVSVGGKTKFTCSDGPTFDGHLVDFDELQMRQGRFLEEEKIAFEKYEGRCECKCKCQI
ncbi:MAG: sulfide/dihydroorotate dehydrogenase-like FAD/NAD-binding protein [bacterium]